MIQNSRVLHRISNVLGVVLAIAAVSVLRSQTPEISPSDQKILSEFSHKAQDYMDKEHSLTADKMKPTTDVAKLEQQRHQLRDAVQQSRPNAKQGDLFTPEVSQVFRRILVKLFNGPDGAKIRTSLQHAEPSASTQFKVNADFPNRNGQPTQSVPPTVLQVLPALPKGLEYCMAGNTLALRDASANMVVDFLPNALP